MTAILTPDEVMERLSQGNERWMSGDLRHPHQGATRRYAVAVPSQDPIAAVLTCSDSRVCPEQLMDVGVGDLFTIRVAGNVPSPGVVASLEFAALELGLPLFVVLGHTGCGALNAAVRGGCESSEMAQVLDLVAPAVAQARGEAPGAEPGAVADLAAVINARAAAAELLRNCPGVRALVATGRSRVVAALYDLGSGALSWLD